MELYHFNIIVTLGLMMTVDTSEAMCRITSKEDSGCKFYIATSDYGHDCYMRINNNDTDFSARKSETPSEVLLYYIETKPTVKWNHKGKNVTRRESNWNNITENIGAKWTRIQAITSGGGRLQSYVTGNRTIPVPDHFKELNTFIWVKGSISFTNKTTCFSKTHKITTSLSTNTQYMTTTQSTGSHYLNTIQSTDSLYLNTTQSTGSQYINNAQSTTSDYIQSTPSTESATTAGPSEQWWLYVIIGVLIMIAALLAVTAAFLKRRKTDVHDTMILRYGNQNASMSNDISNGPQVPDFYGNTEGGLETASNPEDHIYEDPDLYTVTHTYEKKNSGERPLTPKKVPTTRRGSAHDSENSLYGCVTGGDF